LFVTIPEEITRRISAWAKDAHGGIGGSLFGRVLDDGDVIQIAAVEEDGGERVGLWGALGETDDAAEIFLDRMEAGDVVVAASKGASALWVACRTAGGLEPVEYDVIHLHADFASRLDGLFDTRYLAEKTATVIGLGTGGSLVATELAKNGVGAFRLVDFDRLETHNIARHACGLSDIGRYKTCALADQLYDKHPAVQVELHEFNVLEDVEVLRQIVTGSDLVIAATDSEASKRQINRVCWQEGIPAVYGAAYDRAFGGDVLRVSPPDSACYECFYKQITEIFNTTPKKTIDYSVEDPTQVMAEPGLGLDVAFIGLILAKMSLLTLLEGSESSLEDFPTDYVMWGNRPEWIFEQPLQSLFMDVTINPTCPVCHAEAYVEQELGMTVEEAQEKGQEAIDDIESMPVSTLKTLDQED
jgi:molybdopterin/thiamine biosynthesis adenylyltransferase